MNMEELYQKHKPLICWVAKHYQWALERDPSLDMDDLLQAGYIGLQTAAETYDSSRGTWATWAVPCIRGEIQSAAGRRKTEPPLSLDGACYTNSEGEPCFLLDSLPDDTDIEEAVTEAQRQAALRKVLQKSLNELTSERSREAIRRVDYAGQTLKQAAESHDHIVGQDQRDGQTDGAENALQVFFGTGGHGFRSFRLREQGLLW